MNGEHKNQGILICYFIFLFLLTGQTFSQMKKIPLLDAYSEGNFYLKDGSLYVDAIVVKFNDRVIELDPGLRYAEKINIRPIFSNILQSVNKLDDKYGLVKIVKHIRNARWGDIYRRHKITGEMVQIHDLSQLFTLRFSSPVPYNSTINELIKLPEVEYAHQPSIIVFDDEPNDTKFEDQWNLEYIDAVKAWDITHGSSSVKIGIVDSGVDQDHEDLAGNIDGGDEVEDNHGTMVAGVAAAVTDNNKGVASPGWSVKMYTYGSSLETGDESYLEEDINSATATSHIINMSWGTFRVATLSDIQELCPKCDYPQLWVGSKIPTNIAEIDTAITNAVNTGVICIAAAGNKSRNWNWENYEYDPEDCDPCKIPFSSYPAQYSNVIAVSGTQLVSEVEQYIDEYNWGYFIDVAAPAKNIWKPSLGGGYNNTADGTSFATPLVSGLAGLIKSVNFDLTVQQVKDILTGSADKIDTEHHGYDQNGHNSYLGYGRINAYQAVLLALAYDMKTPLVAPTVYNHLRITARGEDDTNYVYQSFYSGTSGLNEIFFRRSTNDGSTWSDPERVSPGNLNNRGPCITVIDEGSVDHVHMVWQRKKSNGKYQVLYRKSTNSGSTWSLGQVILADEITCSSYQPYGPMPVITHISSGGSKKLIVAWVSNSGLRTRICSSGSWGTEQAVQSGIALWYPSIMGHDDWASLVYSDRYTVYSRKRGYSDSQWSSSSYVDNIGQSHNYDRCPQVAITPDDSTLAVWYAYKDGKYRVLYRVGDSNNSWSDNYWEWIAYGSIHSLLPNVTYNPLKGSVGRVVTFYTDDKRVWMAKTTTGTRDWAAPVEIGNSDDRFPHITHVHHGSPYMLWAGNQSDPDGPYTLEYTKNGFSKAAGTTSTTYHRRAGIENSADRTGLYVEIGEFEAVKKSGERVSLDFVPCNESEKLDFDTNLMNNLSIKPATLPSDVENLEFYFEVYTNCHRDTLVKKITTEFKSFDVNIHITDKSTNQSYSIQKRFSDPNGSIDFNQTMEINAKHLAGRQIVLKPEITGVEVDDEKYIYSMGHVHIFHDGTIEKSLPLGSQQLTPNRFVLNQNIPNPFNPETSISYSIPAEGHVTLKIYDILGKEVITLVNEVEAAGNHKVIWNSRDEKGNPVPSGVYIYRITSGSHVEQKKMILLK